ncbi:MAG: polyprenyl diphosphate synthase, partial [Candidatus Gracilibacteria bacterium]|nr:polyprenyl diphosphate synthase [Candidatus Gracilibacteria bacterium]
MDGNRRWAKSRLLPSFAGHKAGADNIIKIIKICIKNNIEFGTFWALSTENIKSRSDDELKYLFGLLDKMPSFLKEMLDFGVKFETIGDLDLLPEKTKNILLKLKFDSKNNSNFTFILAVGYGGRNEIIRGIKKFINFGGDLEKLDEKSFLQYLDTGIFPEPDLLIRTGGDIRLSGFMQYVSDYSEYYFNEKKWPEFDENEL